MQPIQPLLQPSHFPVDERVSYTAPVVDHWQRLYYSELWIRTVYRYRALRSMQLTNPLNPKQAEQFSRLEEIVYEPPRNLLTPRRFRCCADATLQVASLVGLEFDVRVLELSPCGAKIDQAPERIEACRITLMYRLQIFDEGTLHLPARAISSEGGQLELAFIGAPNWTRHE